MLSERNGNSNSVLANIFCSLYAWLTSNTFDRKIEHILF